MGLGVSVLGALLALGLVSGIVVARAAPAAEVTLRLWPAGQGRIEVVQGGKSLDPDPCGFEAILASTSACVVTVTTGAPVTLRAIAEPGAQVPVDREADVPDFPVAQPAFVRWSRGDCGTAETCTFTPDADSDGDWITAVFTPLQLQVGVFGVGDVSFRRPDGAVVTPPCAQGVGFGDRTCHAAFPADADIVVDVSPAPTGWGRCEADAGNAARCTVTMSNLRTFAFVSFDGQDPLDPPFQLTPKVKVRRTGSGQGSVSGSGIDCPPTCEVAIDYQSRVRLRAQESSGSTFVRWVGVCATDRTCVFAAGSATEVFARFDADAPPATTATTTRTTTSTTTPTTTTTTTTATTTTGPVSPRLRARVASVFVRGRGARRVLAFTVVVNRRARATARLVRQRKAVAARSDALASGRNALRLRVPRSARPGSYRLSVRVVSGPSSQTIVVPVTIRR